MKAFNLLAVGAAAVFRHLRSLSPCWRMAAPHFVTSDLSPFRRRPSGTSHLSTKSAPLRSLALLSVLCAFTASGAEAQYIGPPPPGSFHGHGGMHGGRGFFYPFVFVEQQSPVIIEREVVREVPVVVEPPPPPPPPRKPYKIGASYDSLPGGCMKLIEEGASYYLCSGEWYRQVGSGSAATYKAVAKR